MCHTRAPCIQTDLCVFGVSLCALRELKKTIHVILETGRDVARLQECIDVVVIAREEVIHLAERLVLHQ